MPIEIRELHIKAVVGKTNSHDRPAPDAQRSKEEQEELLINECVERVMDVLARKAER